MTTDSAGEMLMKLIRSLNGQGERMALSKAQATIDHVLTMLCGHPVHTGGQPQDHTVARPNPRSK